MHKIGTALIVGAGVVGLTTALELCSRGWQVKVYTNQPVSETTSWLAAAVWHPTSVGPKAKVLEWGKETYGRLIELVGEQVPGVYMRKSLALVPKEAEIPWWSSAVGGVVEADKAELPPGYNRGFVFDAPLAEMPIYMRWLESELVRRGGTISIHHVDRIEHLVGIADVVINCTGLASRTFAHDSSVFPIRGQVVRVSNPGLNISVRDEYNPGGRTYVHPRTNDVICGGTADENEWDLSRNAEVSDQIMARCKLIAPALAETTVLQEVVGLRPARQAVRLERGADLPKGTPIFHNYGHGGAGVTLSWGCARALADLVEA